MNLILRVQQNTLNHLGFDASNVDGQWGFAVDGGLLIVLTQESDMFSVAGLTAELLPHAKMQRIIFHWTAGNNLPSQDDLLHYHFVIGGAGQILRGKHLISANQAPLTDAYAAHTRGCNTGSIGVALAGMAGAIQSPFSTGKQPINAVQWNVLIDLCVTLCRAYKIEPSQRSLLSHAEVQSVLLRPQNGKWDIARLPWLPSVVGAKAVGDLLRNTVFTRMKGTS